MLINLKKKTEGFTIIEVMIVLVIAAVILLIVFLAVPALQRSSRNTQRKNDVANYAAAVGEWAGNNSGTLPAVATDLTTANTGVNAFANLGFYTTEPGAVTAAAATVTNTATTTTFLYVPGTICNATNGATNTGASGRQFTLLYATESSSGSAIAQCQAS